MKINFTDTALKQLRAITKGNKQDAQRILNRIEAYAQEPQEKHDVKILKGSMGDRYRLRAGDYRVIFKKEKQGITISLIKHRRDVYHD